MLTGDHIILRPLKVTDWEKTIKWRNNISIKQQAMMHPFPITELVEKEWYEEMVKSKSNKLVYFTITQKKDDKPIGFCMLNNINYIHKRCELGIVIGNEESQGKGYGKEAMELLINYAFYTLNLNKITLEVVENNIAAIKLYKNLDFIEEGKLIQHLSIDGYYSNVYILSKFK